jgi:formylmethanofuran dehydrogenase subunit E
MSLIESKTNPLATWIDQSPLEPLLAASAARHRHLCPRQVLGVRIGLAGAAALDLEAPRTDKRLLCISETPGCFLDGLEAATGSAPGRRTMFVVDYGKVAATFIDVKTGTAIRVAPQSDVRQRAQLYASQETRRYHAMLHGYQAMPENELLTLEEIKLANPLQEWIGRAGVRTACERCGEEISNQREVIENGVTLCRPCAGKAYYQKS